LPLSDPLGRSVFLPKLMLEALCVEYHEER
jgi:hypothetical protein